MEAILIVHNIRSAQNVGSLFRSADGVGVSHIYLSTTTPSPMDRFGRARSDIAKTALGAEKTIPWSHYDEIVILFETLRTQGYEIVALEQDERAIDYKHYQPKHKVALVVGNEVEGIERGVLDQVDTIVLIPMRGKKESLNVAVAGAIALYRFFDR